MYTASFYEPLYLYVFFCCLKLKAKPFAHQVKAWAKHPTPTHHEFLMTCVMLKSQNKLRRRRKIQSKTCGQTMHLIGCLGQVSHVSYSEWTRQLFKSVSKQPSTAIRLSWGSSLGTCVPTCTYLVHIDSVRDRWAETGVVLIGVVRVRGEC